MHPMQQQQQQQQPSTSRILYDVPCMVCDDHSSGKHYGVFACDGCAGFFKRSVRRDRQYACKARMPGQCLVDKAHRNQCRACRLAKCLEAGMNRDAVQHERGPRLATARRQIAMMLKEEPPSDTSTQQATAEAQTPRAIPPVAPVPMFPYPYNASLGMFIPQQRAPTPPPLMFLNLNEPAEMCEAAARLLFVNVRWAESVVSFDGLSLQDRLLLLGESWKYLFVIGTAQFMYHMDLWALVQTNSLVSIRDAQIYAAAAGEIVNLQPDLREYELLRRLALFRTSLSEGQRGGHMRRFQDLPTIASLQNQSQIHLQEYSSQYYPMDPYRSSKLLQLIQVLSNVSGEAIVELFFRATIGAIPIEKIIGDMYRTSKLTD